MNMRDETQPIESQKAGTQMTVKEGIRRLFGDAFSLSSDTAPQEEIQKRLVYGAAIKGTNMCVLILAILIASIGLNMNSTAVIIGAMLISPLMGSIMAVAYGFASGKIQVIRHYFFGFVLQLLISLLTSTLYFSLTPISSSTSELLARTNPTIWDVLIAFCGGLAGCIGSTRKEKSNNVIPGVAIATALMPPLCTAGYGLATRQYRFFFGAFYLFALNTYFICLASVLVLMMLKVPRHTVLHESARKRVKRRIIVATVLILLPSIFFAAKLVMKDDITGFEDQAVEQMQELGDEAVLLFPQIDRISLQSGYIYQEGSAHYGDRLTVTLWEPMPEENQDTLLQWLHRRYPLVETVEIVLDQP